MSNAIANFGTPESGPWVLPYRGRIGMVFLIVSETALFTIFVVAYLFYVGKSVSGPYPADVLDLPLVATVCLVSSSGTIALAERALRHGRGRSFRLWWLLTVLLGIAFLAKTGVEWSRLIFEDKLTIASNLFGTSFYALVGLHATHVLVGLLLLLLVMLLAVGGAVRQAEAPRIEMLTWYWHFVDAVWGVVFFVVYIIGR